MHYPILATDSDADPGAPSAAHDESPENDGLRHDIRSKYIGMIDELPDQTQPLDYYRHGRRDRRPHSRERQKSRGTNAGGRRQAARARGARNRDFNAEGDCFAMCVAAVIDFDKVRNSSNTLCAPRDMQIYEEHGNGENLVIQLQVFGGKDLFAFKFGCLVGWGLLPSEIDVIKEWGKSFLSRPLQPREIEEERVEFVPALKQHFDNSEEDAEDTESMAPVMHDQIVLFTTSHYERLAHSYAMAQSVKLGVFESAVDRSIAESRNVPETMATTGEVNLNARDLAKQMGGLLMLRCDVNLHTDILDTPDIFWEEDCFEANYDFCRNYLDIDKRVEILNARLEVLKDLYDLLQNGLNVKNGNKLEWIIIILILLEVILELGEVVHDAFMK